MLEGSTLTAARVGGIVVGVLVVNVALRIALGRFFTRAERGDAERIASLRQVARTAQRVVALAQLHPMSRLRRISPMPGRMSSSWSFLPWSRSACPQW